MDKNIRKSLIEKYLNAEMDAEQERMLAEWFAGHSADADEEAVAKMLLAEYPDAGYAAGEREFDAVLASHRKKRSRFIKWAYGIAACAVVAVGLEILMNQQNACDFDGIEIAQSIERIMALDMENVSSITAKPKGSKVILTAVMNDGSKCMYVMSKDKGTSTISITAMAD